MTNALKGFLLSALVLPGLGQFVLQRRMRGILLMLAVLALVGTLMVQAMRTVMTVLANIDMEVEQVDVTVFYDAIRQASTASGTLLSWLLLLCWLGAAVDAYLLGRNLDKGEKSPSPTS